MSPTFAHERYYFLTCPGCNNDLAGTWFAQLPFQEDGFMACSNCVTWIRKRAKQHVHKLVWRKMSTAKGYRKYARRAWRVSYQLTRLLMITHGHEFSDPWCNTGFTELPDLATLSLPSLDVPVVPAAETAVPAVEPAAETDDSVVKPDAEILKPADAEIVKPDAEIVKPADEIVKPADEIVKPAAAEIVKPDAETVKPAAKRARTVANVPTPFAIIPDGLSEEQVQAWCQDLVQPNKRKPSKRKRDETDVSYQLRTLQNIERMLVIVMNQQNVIARTVTQMQHSAIGNK